MKYYSVPADFKKETIDKYVELHRKYNDSRVKETYGNITVGNYFESGRPANVLPPIDIDGLKDYIHYSRSKDIDFHYTINATHMNNREFTRKGLLELTAFLEKLYDAGVRSLTIAMPSLLELVQSMNRDFKVKTSTLCSITNATKALAYKKMGVDRIVADESVNRDFQSLKRIRNAFGEKVELIVNAICHKNCIYRAFHYNQMSSDSIVIANEKSLDYYPNRCLMQRYQTVSDLLKLTWIRPEDIHYYTEIGINYFKLQGRQAVIKGDPLRAVEAYFKESYDGELFELLDMFDPTSSFRVKVENKRLDGFIKPFANTTGNESFCKNECEKCQYCDNFTRKAIDSEDAKKVFQLAENFFDQCDTYDKMLVSLNDSGETEQNSEMDVDFDI